MKEIARLKSDLKQLQSDDKWDEINRVKDELEMQTKEF